MFIEFSIGNYLSFKEQVTFSMVASKIVAKDKTLDQNNVFKIDDDLSLLKSAAIYGANASGKSNFISALSFMRELVLNSSKETQAAEPIETEAFRLDSAMAAQPSFFEMVFLLEGKKYRYGFEADTEKVVSEWLFFTPKTKEAKLFTRDSSGIALSGSFKEGKGIVERTRTNALFLSVVAQFNGAIAERILSWFRRLGIISSTVDLGIRNYTVKCLESDDVRSDIVKLIKRLDLGIDDFQIEKVKMIEATLPKNMPGDIKRRIPKNSPNKVSIRTLHKKYDSDGHNISAEMFDLDKNESDGTKKLFSLAGPLVDTLKHGNTLVIDELDARLHRLMTCEIIRLFNSNETNPHNAQLIFTTHDTSLLTNTLFRRDQIWFAEKKEAGATDLYSLAEFKVRNDASYEKDYIQGRYGAVPFVGDIHRLVGDSNGQ
ncbi:MAG: ATP-binding protein [Acidobacteriota bacterium]